MGCSVTLAGISSDCLSNKGGVKAVYLINREDIADLKVAENVITGITLTSASTKFKKFEFRKDSASMTSTLTIGDNGGSNYVSTVVTMSFNRMDAAKRLEMNAMAFGELAALVEDRNGTVYYLGYDEAVKASNGTGETGAARTDLNQYTAELTDESDLYPFTVDPALLNSSALIDGVANE